MKWQGKDGNIPSSPILLTVPKSLELQFTNELRRYLRPKTFDILPYTGTWEKRQDWWSQVWSSSKHDPSRRIVLAATTVSNLTLLIAIQTHHFYSHHRLLKATDLDHGPIVQMTLANPCLLPG
jgi:hypothetical protein